MTSDPIKNAAPGELAVAQTADEGTPREQGPDELSEGETPGDEQTSDERASDKQAENDQAGDDQADEEPSSADELLAARGEDLMAAIARGESVKTHTHDALSHEDHVLHVNDFKLWYGQAQALYDISMSVPKGKVTALIGPSGCGKSTLLRSVNRLNDLLDIVRIEGDMLLSGDSIYDPSVDVIELRKRMGMVFQKSNPFPMSIYENVVYSLRIDGERNRKTLDDICERSLRGAALWDEVKDRLQESALGLSGGQQQRLCIARAIAAEPEVLLMDEPCSALDPIATSKIEELIAQLKGEYTILIVTHGMQQASRASDYCAFMYLGRLMEYGPTVDMFTSPHLKETEDYINGRFG